MHDGSHLWVASSASSRKFANVRQIDSLAVDGGAAHSPYVALPRTTVVDDVSAHLDVIDAFARKYGGYDVADESGYGALVLLRLTITRWLLKDAAE